MIIEFESILFIVYQAHTFQKLVFQQNIRNNAINKFYDMLPHVTIQVTVHVTADFISIQYKFAISVTSYTSYHFFLKKIIYIIFLLLMVTW